MTWLRLEGTTRDPELTEGLAAQVADPLWTLTRQWQVGEFAGEDAASPVLVTAEVAVAPITAFAPGEETAKAGPLPRADADRPLEVLVEQEDTSDDDRGSRSSWAGSSCGPCSRWSCPRTGSRPCARRTGLRSRATTGSIPTAVPSSRSSRGARSTARGWPRTPPPRPGRSRVAGLLGGSAGADALRGDWLE